MADVIHCGPWLYNLNYKRWKKHNGLGGDKIKSEKNLRSENEITPEVSVSPMRSVDVQKVRGLTP